MVVSTDSGEQRDCHIGHLPVKAEYRASFREFDASEIEMFTNKLSGVGSVGQKLATLVRNSIKPGSFEKYVRHGKDEEKRKAEPRRELASLLAQASKGRRNLKLSV